MGETLKRVQMLIEPEQHRILREVAKRQGKSVAEVTRHVLDLGIRTLEEQEEFALREQALADAARLRRAIRSKRGGPLHLDVVTDLNQIREERDDQSSMRR